jgi:hypothetical protein
MEGRFHITTFEKEAGNPERLKLMDLMKILNNDFIVFCLNFYS